MSTLDNVPPEKAFILGEKRITNVELLLEELKEVSDVHYGHYASRDHNYFSDWIENIVGDTDLALKLRHTRSRREALAVLKSYIDALKEPRVVVGKSEQPKTKIKAPPKEKLRKPPKKEHSKSTQQLLKGIARDEREIKEFLWKHFAWDMAKEFMYGMAIGILIGFVLSKIFFSG
jgi:hypothetical protein